MHISEVFVLHCIYQALISIVLLFFFAFVKQGISTKPQLLWNSLCCQAALNAQRSTCLFFLSAEIKGSPCAQTETKKYVSFLIIIFILIIWEFHIIHPDQIPTPVFPGLPCPVTSFQVKKKREKEKNLKIPSPIYVTHILPSSWSLSRW